MLLRERVGEREREREREKTKESDDNFDKETMYIEREREKAGRENIQKKYR